MTTYTTLVNVDANIAKTLADFIASRLPEEESAKFYKDCQALIADKKSGDLVNKLLEQSEFILALEKDSGEIIVFLLLLCVHGLNTFHCSQRSKVVSNRCFPYCITWETLPMKVLQLSDLSLAN
jgi:hypothetical protein